MRFCAGQRSAEEELLLRAANLTLQAPAEVIPAAPVCCRRDHGVFLSDAYIQLMTPHVRAMLASPASAPPAPPPFSASHSSIPVDAIEVVKVTSPLSPCPHSAASRCAVGVCFNISGSDQRFQSQVQLPVASQPVTRAIAAKSPEVCGPLLYNESRRHVPRRACDVLSDALLCVLSCTFVCFIVQKCVISPAMRYLPLLPFHGALHLSTAAHALARLASVSR